MSDKGFGQKRISEVIRNGDQEWPETDERILDFERFKDSTSSNQIQVILSNTGNEKTVPIYTTIIPEIKKWLCYNGPDNLNVVFVSRGKGHLADYGHHVVRGTVASGAWKEFYLVYGEEYFFELLVTTSNPQAVGFIGNWSQELFDSTGNGFVYDQKFDAVPMQVNASIQKTNEDDPDNDYYYVKMSWQPISSDTILIH